MSAFLFALGLVLGFLAGRLYQWGKHTLVSELLGSDPSVAAHRAAADIAAQTRRAEERIRRLKWWQSSANQHGSAVPSREAQQ